MEWFNAVRETQAQMEKFIWEEDDMLSAILGVRDKSDKSIQHLEIKGTVPMPCVPVNAADPTVIHKTRTRLMTHRARLQTSEEDKAQLAVSRWKLILSIDLTLSRAGRNIMEAGTKSQEQFDATVTAEITDSLGVKKPSTALERSGALLKFIKWCNMNLVDPLPIKEPVAYRYLQQLDMAPTAGQSFIQALNFAGGIFGLEGALEAVSPRLKGIAARTFQAKRPTKRADPLAAIDLLVLETAIADERESLYDRTMAGYVLRCTTHHLSNV